MYDASPQHAITVDK